MTKNKVINFLLDCEDRAYGYHINEKVLGFPVGQFEDLMHKATAMLKAEPKRGRWVKMTGMMPPEYHGHYECSECQWHLKGLRNSWNREEEMYYCPHCGALMRNEEISDENDGT